MYNPRHISWYSHPLWMHRLLACSRDVDRRGSSSSKQYTTLINCEHYWYYPPEPFTEGRTTILYSEPDEDSTASNSLSANVETSKGHGAHVQKSRLGKLSRSYLVGHTLKINTRYHGIQSWYLVLSLYQTIPFVASHYPEPPMAI